MNRIRELREERHLNQQGLALKLNTSQSLISYYEKGARLPDMKLCMNIADFFHVSLDYLAGRSDVRNPEVSKNLTELESNILLRLKMLDKEAQKQVDAFIKGLLAR